MTARRKPPNEEIHTLRLNRTELSYLKAAVEYYYDQLHQGDSFMVNDLDRYITKELYPQFADHVRIL
jgi:hypothetical protein